MNKLQVQNEKYSEKRTTFNTKTSFLQKYNKKKQLFYIKNIYLSIDTLITQ